MILLRQTDNLLVQSHDIRMEKYFPVLQFLQLLEIFPQNGVPMLRQLVKKHLELMLYPIFQHAFLSTLVHMLQMTGTYPPDAFDFYGDIHSKGGRQQWKPLSVR